MIHGTGRTKRLIAGGAVGLVGLTFAPSVASAAISTTAFCANVPTGQSGFTDIANTAPHTRNIECLKGSGVTAGTTPTTYAPTANVSRAQMATFIANMLDRAVALDAPGAPTLPALPTAGASADAFTDDETSVHENNINRLKQAGIIAGTSATTFSPNDNVTRQQMASFIAQALAFIRGGALTEGADAFTDDETSVHEANINRLATADIVDGVTATTFNPEGLVSRSQMASFVVQAMADLNSDGFISPLPPSGQATFTLPQEIEARNGEAVGDPSSLRTCTITGLPAGASIDAFVAATPSITSDLKFADANSDNVYDFAAGGVIVNVNGANVGPSPLIADIAISPLGAAAITFTSGPGADAELLIWRDSGTDNDLLELVAPSTANANPKLAAEPFGVGCRTVFTTNEAAIGAHPAVGSSVVNRTVDFFIGTDGDTYFWDANDTFQIGGQPLTQAQFEGILSEDGAADTLTVSYAPEPSGVSVFNITSDDIGDIDSAVATVMNLDGGPTINDVRLVVTPDPDNGPGTVYDIYADVNDNGAGAAGELLLGNQTLTPGADGTVTFNFNNLPNGVAYPLLIVSKNPPSGVQELDFSNDITVPGTPDAIAPVSNDVLQSTQGGLAGTLDTGDVIKLAFNETMAAPTAGDTLRVEDGDATASVGDIVCGTNATCTLNAAAESVNGASRPAGSVITVTLTAAPTVVQAGTAAGVQLDGEIIDESGYTDASGVAWSLLTSTDTTIDTDANDTDDGLPAFTGLAADDSAESVVLTFDDPILCSTVDVTPTGAATDDFALTDNGASVVTITSVTCTGATDTTLDLVVSSVVAGDTITATLTSAGALTDADGNILTGGLVQAGVAVA